LSDLLRRQAADLQQRFTNLLDVSTVQHNFSSSRQQRSLVLRTYTEAKCQFLIKYFMALIYFVDLLHMFLSALPIPPPRHARGLGLANLRVARLVGSYLLLSRAINSPPRHTRGLGFANLRVARPVGSCLLFSHAINSRPRHARGLG
jgi:hypothetical protein